MFSRIRGFLSRHKRKFIVGSVVVSTVIFVTRYTQRKLREWQEKEIRDMLERTKRKQYFESVERTCNQMIISLSSTLRETVVKTLDTETCINKLRNGCNDKVGTWDELKVLAVARSALVIYSYAMLATLIRILFNVIGGHMYKDAQSSDGTTMENLTQTKYMSLSSYFLGDGVKKLGLLIRDKVGEITASMSLKDELTVRDLEQIYWAITSSISADTTKDPVKNLQEYMLQFDKEEEQDPILLNLTNETLDLLESEAVQSLTQSNIRSGFALLMDHISEYFIGQPTVKNGTTNGISIPGTSSQKGTPWVNGTENFKTFDTFIDFTHITIPMAKLLPIINGQVPEKPAPKDVPTHWMQQLILNNDLRTLGANIYEAFSF